MITNRRQSWEYLAQLRNRRGKLRSSSPRVIGGDLLRFLAQLRRARELCVELMVRFRASDKHCTPETLARIADLSAQVALIGMIPTLVPRITILHTDHVHSLMLPLYGTETPSLIPCLRELEALWILNDFLCDALGFRRAGSNSQERLFQHPRASLPTDDIDAVELCHETLLWEVENRGADAARAEDILKEAGYIIESRTNGSRLLRKTRSDHVFRLKGVVFQDGFSPLEFRNPLTERKPLSVEDVSTALQAKVAQTEAERMEMFAHFHQDLGMLPEPASVRFSPDRLRAHVWALRTTLQKDLLPSNENIEEKYIPVARPSAACPTHDGLDPRPPALGITDGPTGPKGHEGDPSELVTWDPELQRKRDLGNIPPPLKGEPEFSH